MLQYLLQGVNIMNVRLEELDHFSRCLQRKPLQVKQKEVVSSMGKMVDLLIDQKNIKQSLANIQKIENRALQRGENTSEGKIYDAKKCAIEALQTVERHLSSLISEHFPSINSSI